MALCIGMDAHHRTCTYKVKDEHGNLLDEDTILSTRDALLELAKQYPDATLVVEASSVHEWIYDLLTDAGMHVVPAHPSNMRRLIGKGRKSDALDAGFLVDMYLLGVLPRAYVPPKPIRELRQLVRRRAYLIQQRTRYTNRIHGLLKRKGVRILAEDAADELDEVSDILANKQRARLLRLGEPEVPVMLRLIDGVTKELQDANLQVEKAAESIEDVKRLMTIPGFGPLVALAVYAEVGAWTAFPTRTTSRPTSASYPEKIRRGSRRSSVTSRRRARPWRGGSWVRRRGCTCAAARRAASRRTSSASRRRRGGGTPSWPWRGNCRR